MPRQINPHHIHIWQYPLTLTDEQLTRAWQVLNTRERERANRFVFAIHRHRFVAAQAGLRTMLSHYIKQSAAAITYDFGPHGKPELTADINPQQLRFNMSHSADMAVYALTLQHDIGIDIEQIKPRGYLHLAKRYFSVGEYQQLKNLPAEQLVHAFFHVWTQKEAFIKAIGFGFSYPLHDFTVNAKQPAQLITAKGYNAKQWQLQHIDVGNNNYCCSVATCQISTTIEQNRLKSISGPD